MVCMRPRGVCRRLLGRRVRRDRLLLPALSCTNGTMGCLRGLLLCVFCIRDCLFVWSWCVLSFLLAPLASHRVAHDVFAWVVWFVENPLFRGQTLRSRLTDNCFICDVWTLLHLLAGMVIYPRFPCVSNHHAIDVGHGRLGECGATERGCSPTLDVLRLRVDSLPQSFCY
jgi:hypothetical protein